MPYLLFFFKQKTAYEIPKRDWSSDVCSSDLDHLIYRSFYKIDRVRCIDPPRDIQLEALFVQGNLVAIMCEDGLCCAFAAKNNCNKGKGIDPEDGQKLALNIAVYALTH